VSSSFVAIDQFFWWADRSIDRSIAFFSPFSSTTATTTHELPAAAAAMVSDASKKKAASKKAAAAEKRGSKSAAAVAQSKLKDVQNGVSNDAAVADEMAALMITDRTCTGVLASHPQSRDIHVSFVFVSCCLIWIFVLGSTVYRSHASPLTCQQGKGRLGFILASSAATSMPQVL
jgi:hypothetical protein